MKKYIGLLFVAILPMSHATLIQINFVDGTGGSVGTTSINGSTWNTVVSKSTTNPDVADLQTSTGQNSGISMTWIDGFGFANNSRGEGGTGASGTSNDGLSTYDADGVTLVDGGKFIPWAVMGSYNASNSGPAVNAFSFKSSTQFFFDFHVAASREDTSGITDTLYNVGGVYDSNTNTFVGGTTLTLNPSTTQGTDLDYAVGRLTDGPSGFLAAWNGTEYELTFQVAKDGSLGGSNARYLNGLVMETTVIPEPGTLVLLGIAFGTLMVFHRRR